METKELLLDYFHKTHDLFNSIVIVCPLLVLYEFGLFFIDVKAIIGVDFLTIILKELGTTVFIIFNLAVTAFFIVAIIYLSKKERFHPNYIFGVIIESAVYATLIAVIIIVILQQTGFIASNGRPQLAATSKLILSLGAGVYEEIVFRLGLFGGFFALLRKIYKMDKGVAFIIACVVSSVLFSVAHFLGSERATMVAFLWRLLAGILLVTIFHFRSFAVAVYTHVLYDVYAFLFQPGA